MLRRLVLLILLLPACRDADTQPQRSNPKASASTAQVAPSAPQDQEPTPVLGDFCFNGTLGEKPISGVLKALGNRVHGEYSSAGGSKLKLTGTRAGTTVQLEQRAANGSLTGSFEGTVTPGDGHYKGTWTGPGSAKKLPFDLTPTGCGPEYW